ncbi:MAG: type II toxin-antitoxin system VapC family toxin [Tessaracoccus sp.]
MNGFLLDTNVVSELAKRGKNPQVVEWVLNTPDCYLSILTLGEIKRGAWLHRNTDPRYTDRLFDWLRQLEASYSDHTLAINRDVMHAWASIPTRRTLPVIEGLLAATALAHDLTVATRNIRDFADTGVATFNPSAELLE